VHLESAGAENGGSPGCRFIPSSADDSGARGKPEQCNGAHLFRTYLSRANFLVGLDVLSVSPARVAVGGAGHAHAGARLPSKLASA